MNRVLSAMLALVILTPIGSGDRLLAQSPGFGTPELGQGQPGQGQPGQGQSTLPANEVTNFKGTLKGMQRNILVVEKEDGSEALIALPDSISSFQFIAKATPAFLQRGMLVRFSANFGPGGVPLAPVEKVTLFQPVDLRSVQGRAKEQFAPGIYSEANRGNRNPSMVGKLSVVGRLIGLAPNGVLAVQAGKLPVRVAVDPNTQLEVRYNNLVLAQEGDPVTVAGFYQPPNENQVKAERITITTDRVYGETQPAVERRSRRRRVDKDQENKPAEALGSDAEKGENPEAGEGKADTEKEDS